MDLWAGDLDGRRRAPHVPPGVNASGVLAALTALRERLPVTARIVQTNRSMPPDFINIRVDELSGDKPFRHIDDLISQAELREMSDGYKRIAGFSLEALKT